MNKGQRNHNPVNLRYMGQWEATGKDDTGFAVFPDGPTGWRAAHNQIFRDQGRGLTLKQFIFKFAPPVENDTNRYLQFVAGELDKSEDDLLSAISPYALAGVMAKMEGYYNK